MNSHRLIIKEFTQINEFNQINEFSMINHTSGGGLQRPPLSKTGSYSSIFDLIDPKLLDFS